MCIIIVNQVFLLQPDTATVNELLDGQPKQKAERAAKPKAEKAAKVEKVEKVETPPPSISEPVPISDAEIAQARKLFDPDEPISWVRIHRTIGVTILRAMKLAEMLEGAR